MVRRPQVGEVFVIPVGDGRGGIGQVVATYGVAGYYFAVFDAVVPLDVAHREGVQAITAPILLLALSMDAKLYVGDWERIGVRPVSAEIPFPAYKEAVGTPDNIQVVDYSGRHRRPATASEAESLPNRKVVAPVRLERALRAHLGLEPWTASLLELCPLGRATSAEAFPE